jgi:beta-lactamase class A
MAGAGRAIAGVAVTLVAALMIFLGFRGHGDDPPPRPAGTTAAETAGAPGHSTAAPSPTVPAGRTSAPAASSSPPAPSAPPVRHADPLTGNAAASLAGRSGTVLAAVEDLTTGQSWQLGGGPAQDEASVVKLNILETLLAQRGSGGLSPSDQSLAQAMIEDSDNDAATSLWYEAGGATGLTAYNDRTGLTSTSPSPCVVCAGFAWPGWGLSTTVPQDQLTLLKQLVAPGPRPLLTGAERSYALSLMEHVAPDQRWGASGGVPAGVTVALKDGWLPLNAASTDWQINSVGWVNGDGRDYLVAVFSTGNPTEQYGIDTINGLSAAIWAAMS